MIQITSIAKTKNAINIKMGNELSQVQYSFMLSILEVKLSLCYSLMDS